MTTISMIPLMWRTQKSKFTEAESRAGPGENNRETQTGSVWDEKNVGSLESCSGGLHLVSLFPHHYEVKG